ncbi:NrdH-redoxin [Candidatus Giovannonibacteria bacterium RIFCSPHIGHO2_02_42_15]|uniref:NrdH-redoxin n=2 Tax=Candidatus Giovannoniibacteriota TaxID=1752738 RepID=A0A1F5VKN3_9BACT|nr:MAG: Glutaredoxin-like protein, YruB-family [Candidatus Giovannonibacteria bacterium GW2011_GWF2_42_19]OGF63778.1 MAG: NrdH-redoxin [Candidatus Giovannonibacteria bacterium RIFCSPHIGHO2_02_42_15]
MKDVKIYTTPVCSYCKMAKDLFQKNNIQFTEYNVATDVKAREEMVQRSGQLGVPVIFVNNDIVVGFDREKLSRLLEIK